MRNKKGRKEKGEKLDVSVHVHEEEREAKERKGHQETKIYKNIGVKEHKKNREMQYMYLLTIDTCIGLCIINL